MVRVDLGKVLLPESVVEAVELHKQTMLECHKGTDTYDMLLKCDFSMWFGDYIYKYGYKMVADK